MYFRDKWKLKLVLCSQENVLWGAVAIFGRNECNAAISDQRFTWRSILVSSDTSPRTAPASLFPSQSGISLEFFFYVDVLSSSFACVSISILIQGFPQFIALCVPTMLLPGDEFSAYRKGYWSLNAWFHIMLLSHFLAFQSTKPTGSSLSSSLYPDSLQFGVIHRNFMSTYLTLAPWLLIKWMGLGGVLQVTSLSCDSFHFGATCCNFLIDRFLYVSFKSDSYFERFPVGHVAKHLNTRRLTSLS